MRQTTSLRRIVNAPRTLKFHLFAFALILVLPPFLFAIAGVAWFTRTELAANETRIQRMASDISASVDREIIGWLTVLDTLGTSALLEQGDLEAFHDRAKAALRNRDAHVILVDTEFNQLLNTRVPFGTELPKTADQESIEIVIKTGRPYVSDSFVGRVSGERVVNVETPIMENGSVRYVLLITFNVSRIDSIIGNEALPQNWIVAVSDRKGGVIARNPSLDAEDEAPTIGSVARASEMGVLEVSDPDSMNWVEAYRWSPTTGWRTSVRVLRSTLDEPFWRSLYGLAALAIVAAFSSIVMASVLAARISRSMTKLRFAAGDLAAGRAIEAARQPIVETNVVIDAIRQAANVISDRTEALRASESQSRAQVEQIRMLMGELAHRNKNILAVLQAIARQILRRSNSLEEFRDAFDARIASLVRSNDLLFGADGAKGRLSELVQAQLSPFVDADGGRVEIVGPDVVLRPEAVQSLGLAFHELATNATKYGALSTPAGKVVVEWHSLDGDGLDLTWREEGGPAVKPPERSGFGQVVIERLTGQNLQGAVDYRFETTGVVWHLKAPRIVASTPAEAAGLEGASA